MRRGQITVVGAATAALLLSISVPLLAHHSMSMFDLEKTLSIQGTVTEVDWGNPHSVFFMDAKEAGADNAPVRNWTIEGPAPRQLVSRGWKPDTIKVGDKVIVSGHPRKDGKPTMILVSLTDANGKEYTAKAPE